MSVLMNDLDDRSFDDLVGEAVTLLPVLAPEWTNHNPSDPGITLVELLAYFTEMLIYRMGRVTPTTKLQFLKLLGGQKWEGMHRNNKLEFLKLLMGREWQGWRSITETYPANLEKEIDCAIVRAGPNELEKAIGYAIQNLIRNDCAVTTQDFEQMAYKSARIHLGPNPSIRVLCVPSANLENIRSRSSAPTDSAHVSVVVVPGQGLPHDAFTNLCQKVKDDLSPHCLLTTRIHVVAPIYLHLSIRLNVTLKSGQSLEQLLTRLPGMLKQRFGSEPGSGPTGEGWPFGKPLYISELIETIDDIWGIDYVEDVAILQISTGEDNLTRPESALGVQIGIHSTLGHDALLGGPRILGLNRLVRNEAGKLISITLKPWELLRVSVEEENITVIDPKTRGVRR